MISRRGRMDGWAQERMNDITQMDERWMYGWASGGGGVACLLYLSGSAWLPTASHSLTREIAAWYYHSTTDCSTTSTYAGRQEGKEERGSSRSSTQPINQPPFESTPACPAACCLLLLPPHYKIIQSLDRARAIPQLPPSLPRSLSPLSHPCSDSHDSWLTSRGARLQSKSQIQWRCKVKDGSNPSSTSLARSFARFSWTLEDLPDFLWHHRALFNPNPGVRSMLCTLSPRTQSERVWVSEREALKRGAHYCLPASLSSDSVYIYNSPFHTGLPVLVTWKFGTWLYCHLRCSSKGFQ